MKIMQLWGLYNILTVIMFAVGLCLGGYFLFPYIGLSVIPLGLILLMLYQFLETAFYVRLWYLVDQAEQKSSPTKSQ